MRRRSHARAPSQPRPRTGSLERALVLNRFFHRLLGADSFASLRQQLADQREGEGPDGHSFFYGVLLGRAGRKLSDEELSRYDRAVMDYQARLREKRPDFLGFKYFQYLALLYTEAYLDRLTRDPQAFREELNRLANELVRTDPWLRGRQVAFTDDDLRRIAFFMATGSGKTLLMHVHYWQVLNYLEKGAHPEALVPRLDGQRVFDNILLVTTNEGMSAQHIEEFRLSGIEAVHISEASALTAQRTLDQRVKVIEIHKLKAPGEQLPRTQEAVSVPTEAFGPCNLVFVDEGHKGTGTEAQRWKQRQRAISQRGFLVEYSATFAQAIAAAGNRRADLELEYGKAILFDYSYKYFYTDGYGKDFEVLNLASGARPDAYLLLMGGLLVFYQQLMLFEQDADVLGEYNLEQPLWIFLGSSVSATTGRLTEGSEYLSDVATVVGFFKRLCEDRQWAIGTIERILNGNSGLLDPRTNQDLFKPRLKQLAGTGAETLYDRLTERVLHGRGNLEVWEIKNADGEFGLRVSAPEASQRDYFGVVNIGDANAFRTHIKEQLKVEVRNDQFSHSLFDSLDRPGSPLNVLIGAKKFIEGWNSWRVSAMGLLNLGRGEGAQVIQLFGRGVRLKGKDLSLKRSHDGDPAAPRALQHLETLYIFGWNADYLKKFEQMIQAEGLPRVEALPVEPMDRDEWDQLPIPVLESAYDPTDETWVLSADGTVLRADLAPRVQTAVSQTGEIAILAAAGGAARAVIVRFAPACQTKNGRTLDPSSRVAPVDMGRLHAAVLRHKHARGYHNLFVPASSLAGILEQAEAHVSSEASCDLNLLQHVAERLVLDYVDRFYGSRQREAEARHLRPGRLAERESLVIERYELEISPDAPTRLLEEIQRLQEHVEEWVDGGDTPLPRLHFSRHLYNPIVCDPGEAGSQHVSVSPAGLRESEKLLVEHLKDFWQSHHVKEPFKNWELFLLRNLPGRGVGFFEKTGFYPDFILWIRRPDLTRVVFIEPHGLHHGGLSGAQGKIDALQRLRVLSKSSVFQAAKIVLDGYLLCPTPLEQIPEQGLLSWDDVVTRTDRTVLPWVKGEFVTTIEAILRSDCE